MRPAVVVLLVLVAACRRDAAMERGATGGARRSGGRASSPAPVSSVSDEELVAFTRWQREYMDIFRRHWAELHAVGSDDPNLVIRDPKAFEAQVAEVAARQAPVMKAHWDRLPLKGPKADLVGEALGGIFHFEGAATDFALIVARDEVRLDAARRRFGAKAIDDIVAREPLILEALQQP